MDARTPEPVGVVAPAPVSGTVCHDVCPWVLARCISAGGLAPAATNSSVVWSVFLKLLRVDDADAAMRSPPLGFQHATTLLLPSPFCDCPANLGRHTHMPSSPSGRSDPGSRGCGHAGRRVRYGVQWNTQQSKQQGVKRNNPQRSKWCLCCSSRDPNTRVVDDTEYAVFSACCSRRSQSHDSTQQTDDSRGPMLGSEVYGSRLVVDVGLVIDAIDMSLASEPPLSTTTESLSPCPYPARSSRLHAAPSPRSSPGDGAVDLATSGGSGIFAGGAFSNAAACMWCAFGLVTVAAAGPLL